LFLLALDEIETTALNKKPPPVTATQKGYRGAFILGLASLLVIATSFTLPTKLMAQQFFWATSSKQPLSQTEEAQQAQTIFKQVWEAVFLYYYKEDFNHQNWQYWLTHYQNKLKTTQDATVAIQTMLASLNDPYSIFLPPQRFESQSLSIASKLFGIGLQLESDASGNVVVVGTVPNAPAEKAGIAGGDSIVAINNIPTNGIPIEVCAKKIRGNKGTTVLLSLLRKKGKTTQKLNISVIRDEIKFKTVDTFTFKQYPQVGYIKLNSFISEDLLEEVKQALITLKAKKSLIIDVRGNLGGLLENAVELSDLFLDEGTIVSVKSRTPRHQYQASAENGQAFYGKIVILTDPFSASASEVFAGAMKDHHRAWLVGSKTFGKGLVQQVISLNQRGKTQLDSVGLNLTVAQYLTPNGTNIHGIGISPTYPVASETNEALLHSFNANQKITTVEATHQLLTTHLKTLISQGKKEEAWLWVDKPLEKACQLLEPEKP
jgi:carboxyl-terminal processing protease